MERQRATLRIAARHTEILCTMALLCGIAVIAGCGYGFGGAAQSDPQSGDLSRADFTRARSMGYQAPDQPFWPHRLAELHLAEGSADSAVSFLDQALALDPDYLPSVSLRSQVYYSQSEHQAALSLLQATHDRLGALPDELIAAMALNYEALEDFEQADALFASLDPRRETNEGVLLYHQLGSEDYLESLELAQRAIQHEPTVAAHHNNYGIALLYDGRPDEARAHFQEALKLEPSLAGPLYNLAIVERFYLFDDDLGRDYLNRYLAIANDDPDGLVEAFVADSDAEQGEIAK